MLSFVNIDNDLNKKKIYILVYYSIRPVVDSLTLQWIKYSSENGQAANTQRKPTEVLLDTTIKKLQVSFFGGKMERT